MRTRSDPSDDLPHRVYLRRGSRVWAWFYKAPIGRNHVIARAQPNNVVEIAAAIQQVRLFTGSQQRKAIDLKSNGIERRKLRALLSVEKKAAGMPDWAWRLYRQSKSSRATDRPHLLWTLTAQEFAVIVSRADGRCEVSGLEFALQAKLANSRGAFGPSIDRIDSALGYTAANVRIVCVIVNIAMGNWGEQALIRIASAIAERSNSGQRNPNLESISAKLETEISDAP